MRSRRGDYCCISEKLLIVSGMADTFGRILIVSGMVDVGGIIDLGVNPEIES